jgi:hypothetical protein
VHFALAVVPSAKCTPSTIASVDVTASGRARTTAASSPLPTSTRGGGAAKRSRSAAMSSNS